MKKNPKNTEKIFSNAREIINSIPDNFKCKTYLEKIPLRKIEGGLNPDLSLSWDRVQEHINEMKQGIFDTKQYPVNLLKINEKYYVGDYGHKRIFAVLREGKRFGFDYVWAEVSEYF